MRIARLSILTATGLAKSMLGVPACVVLMCLASAADVAASAAKS